MVFIGGKSRPRKFHNLSVATEFNLTNYKGRVVFLVLKAVLFSQCKDIQRPDRDDGSMELKGVPQPVMP